MKVVVWFLICNRSYNEGCCRFYNKVCKRSYNEGSGRFYNKICNRSYNEGCGRFYIMGGGRGEEYSRFNERSEIIC